MNPIFENKYAYFWIANTIVFVRCKENVILDIDMAITITSDRIRIQNSKSYPVFFEMNGIWNSDKSGRNYLAKYGWLLSNQVALYSNTYKSFAIANFYLNVNKPIVPTILFRKERQAIAFLETSL